MKQNAYEPYRPLETLKPFADDIWTVDGPEISMNAVGLSIPFPTRMTVVRLPGGDLWIHSPIALTEQLAAAIDQLGPVRHLIAPNTLHYWYLPEWQERFPDARSYGAPDLTRRAKRPLRLDETLGDVPPRAWKETFQQCVTRGPALSEVDFLHRPSRTLILTDLVENFELGRVRSRLLRWLIRAAGAADPDGKAPIDMRLSFIGHRKEVRKAARKMREWSPQGIILAHGRCYHADGTAELERAFRWIL